MSQIKAETKGQKDKRLVIEVAAQRRDEFLQHGLLSLPDNDGRLIITVSDVAGDLKKSPKLLKQQYEAYLEEAEIIKAGRAGQYADITIRPQASIEQLTSDLTDPEVSAMTLIGHGSIERIWTIKSESSLQNDFNWRHVADNVSHLKQGLIEQRMCGHFPHYGYLTVPLGTFAVENLSSVHAAVGVILPDDVIGDEYFTSVFNDQDPVLQQLAQLNAAHQRDYVADNFATWQSTAA